MLADEPRYLQDRAQDVQRPDIRFPGDLDVRLPLPIPLRHTHLGRHDADEVPVEIPLGGGTLLRLFEFVQKKASVD